VLGRCDLAPGHLGENLTVEGLADDQVCIGDRLGIGGAEFEVSQPRVTCCRVGIRLGVPEMPTLLVAHSRPGLHLRVPTEDRVDVGDAVVRTLPHGGLPADAGDRPAGRERHHHLVLPDPHRRRPRSPRGRPGST
jgi:MOSC domain-containing protein YiiM